MKIEAAPFAAELKRPFVTALGRKTTTANVGVTITLAGGAKGYGEASSSLAMKHLSQDKLLAAVKSIRPADPSDFGTAIESVWKKLSAVPPAAAAFECALLSAVCASRGLSLREYFGGKLRALETDLTLSAVPPAETEAAVREAKAEGFRVYKVKVGGSFSEDLARVRAVRRVQPKAKILLDGNQGMTPAGALKLVEACLKDGPVGLLEQPLPKDQLSKMPALVKRCPVPVALDESVQTPEDAVRAVSMDACSAINVKVAKSGLLRSLKIAAVARAAKLPLMIGCMAETAAGLDASVALAMGTGFFSFVDLDSDHLLVSDGKAASFARKGPFLTAC